MILAFHGNGQKGTLTPDILRNSFVAYKLDKGMNVESIVISPQTNGWKPKWGKKSWYKNLLDTIMAKYRIDTNQIYVMGYSGGGEGVCTFIKNYSCQGIATFAPVITLSQAENSNSAPKASYYPSGGHDGAWSNGLKTDSIFKYFLTK